MTPRHQDLYRQFAAQTPDLPLFLQPWYLDVVCVNGIWDAAVVQKNGRAVAVLPYFLKQKMGWQYVTMPPFCKQMGPFLAAEFRQPDWEVKLYEALIQELPAGLAAFEQNFHYIVQLDSVLLAWLPANHPVFLRYSVGEVGGRFVSANQQKLPAENPRNRANPSGSTQAAHIRVAPTGESEFQPTRAGFADFPGIFRKAV
jgi:hypothetical protein